MRTLALGLAVLAMTAQAALAQEGAAPPEVVGVFPVQGTNLSAGESDAIGALLAVSYQAAGNDRVLDPTVTGPVLAQQASKPDAARALGLTQYVEVQAVRLSQRIAVHATLRNVHGSQLFEVKTTALSLDDMEQVAERVASSLRRRTPLEYTRNRDNITAKETRAPNRLFAEKVFGVRTGVVLPFASDLSVTPAMFAQFDGRLEGASYFLEFAGGLMLPSNFDGPDEGIGGLIGMLGASYYLTDADIAPYIGGGFSPRIMFGAYQGAAIAANGHLGVMFMRQSSSRFYAELSIDQHLLPLSRDYSYYYNEVYDPETGTYVSTSPSSDDIYPTELGIAVGIGW